MIYSIIISLALLGIGVYYLNKAVSARIKVKKASTWPSTQGKILDSSLQEDTVRTAAGTLADAYIPTVKYQYSVSGNPYTGNRIIFGKSHMDFITSSNVLEKLAIDSDVTVYYNPEDPSDSVISPKSKAGLPSMIPSIFFIFSAIIIFVFSNFL